MNQSLHPFVYFINLDDRSHFWVQDGQTGEKVCIAYEKADSLLGEGYASIMVSPTAQGLDLKELRAFFDANE